MTSLVNGHRVPKESFTVECVFADIPRDERVPQLLAFRSWDGVRQGDDLGSLNNILSKQLRIDGGELVSTIR